ncbi:hypothetical protein MLD38_025481 [Melastoma candidum]|uniref:Uncharacterized protein n=1 Tax=Melastoma candidum TaxID=119954 RepID=A0ACB9NX40_9MYRT|nr:hypothetical protein MLD38_025481 [Melastoma candidum]
MARRKASLFSGADRVDKLLMLFGTLGSVGEGSMSPLTMLALSTVMNRYGGGNSYLTNNVIDESTLKIVYVALLVGVSGFVEGICWTRTAERQTSRLRTEYLRSVLRQDVGFLDNQDTNTFQIVSSMSSDASLIQDVIAEKIPNFLAQLSAFIFSISIAFLLSWRLAAAALPFTLLFIVPGVGFGKLIMNLGVKKQQTYGVAGGIAEQSISSIRTVHSYVGENQTLRRFSNALEKTTEFGIKIGLAKGVLIGSMGMMFAVWAFQAWIGSIFVTEKGEEGGRVFISGICILLTGLSIMNALPNLSFVSDATAAVNRISEMIDHIPAIDSENEKGKVLRNVRGDIQFKQVEFSYPSRPDTLVLDGLNLRVRAGVMVALVGGSGSGKSTIISLLQRFYDPVRGDIYLDGCKLKKLKLKWLRSQMGLVNQEPVLFATSIKENILFGKEDATMESIISAATAANAHDFISKLPSGYDTQVGQFGIQLSGGQKQRIAIARALIRDPKILLLDEATSALDAQSERTVQEALEKATSGRTTVVVAHRLSTIQRANTIFVLRSGKVIESGSHEGLLQMNSGRGGAYREMVEIQQSAVETELPSHDQQSTLGDSSRRRSSSAPSPYNTPRSSWDNTLRPSRENTPRPSWENTPRPSWENTQTSLYSPVFSISIALSVQTHQFDDDDVTESDYKKRPHSGSAKSLLRLLKMNRPEWKHGILGCAGAAGFGVVQAAYAYCLGTVVSIYFQKDTSTIKSKIRIYCLIFLGLAVGSLVVNIVQHYNFAIMGESLVKRVREQMLTKILGFEIGWFDQDVNTSAAICSRIAADANHVRSLLADRVSLLVHILFTAAISFGLALVIEWRISIVVIALQPLIIGSMYSRSKLMKSLSQRARKAQGEVSKLASEAVVNHRTITAFSSQSRILNLFALTLKGPRKENIQHSYISGFGLCICQFLTTAIIAFTYWYGGRLINQGKITSKHLFQVFFILMSTGHKIAEAASMTSDLAKGSEAIVGIFALLDRKSKIEPEDGGGVSIKRKIKGNIQLRNVVFFYPARPEQMIFRGLNLKVDAGKRVAMVGQSGSGKSTIIGLIERFYDPQSGAVLIDERDIKTYNLRSLRSHIALVSQEPTLFAGTIRQNIAYGTEEATEAEITKAATLANAHEFISSMQDGYDTYCGERGVQLSGGQKQRIVIARAILKNPSILLLDEATSALDSVSERLVQESLEKMMEGRTCVVVAHRLSTIQGSDCIALICNGKVAEQGSHRELLGIGEKGVYYSLIRLQHQGYSAS